MKYFFLRHGKLSLPYKDHSEIPFNVMVDLGMKKLNPGIDIDYVKSRVNELSKLIDFEKIDYLFSSPSKRSIETATYIKDFIYNKYQKTLEITIMPELSEIIFDLSKINKMTKDMDLINRFVFENIVSGENAESFVSSARRIEDFFKSLKVKENENAVFITHDFIMRIIELYVENKGSFPADIDLKIFDNTHRNNYLEGFVTGENFSEFQILK